MIGMKTICVAISAIIGGQFLEIVEIKNKGIMLNRIQLCRISISTNGCQTDIIEFFQPFFSWFGKERTTILSHHLLIGCISPPRIRATNIISVLLLNSRALIFEFGEQSIKSSLRARLDNISIYDVDIFKTE